MKKAITYLTLIVLLSGCARSMTECKRDRSTRRDYKIYMYSGGQPVFIDSVKDASIVSEQGNGAYYYRGDTLVELSGDYILISTD